MADIVILYSMADIVVLLYKIDTVLYINTPYPMQPNPNLDLFCMHIVTVSIKYGLCKETETP